MNRLYFYRSLITRIRQYLISKSGTNPVTLTNAVEDKLLQGFSITGNSQQSGAGGKNLFDISTATKYSGFATLEVKAEEQEIIVTQSGSATWISANIIIANSNYLIGKTITASANVVPLGGNSRIRVMWLNGSAPALPITTDIISKYVSYGDTNTMCEATGIVTAPPTSDSKLCLMLYASAGVGYENNITTFTDIQIELGAVKTAYEQYYPLSEQHPSPIQTTELKKSSNLLHTDYFNEPKTYSGVTIQYLADEDCFLLNGTSTASNSFIDTAFLIENADNQPFTLSTFYISGNVTGSPRAVIGKSDNNNFNGNVLISVNLLQNNSNNTKICDKPNITGFGFAIINSGVTFDNYKVKISVTKLENSFDISKVQATANITNNGDSLLIAPSGTDTTATTVQTLSDICPELEVGDNVIANLTLTNDAGVYNAFSSTKAYIYLTISKRTFVADSQYTITQDDLNSKIIFYVNPYDSTTPTENKSTIVNISISKIPTNYEPYGKYGLEIKQEKNILDLYNAKAAQYMTVTEQSENKVVATANNATNNSPVLQLFNKSIPSGNYVLSYTVNIENTPQLQSGADDRRNEMLIFVGGTLKTKTSSIPQDGTYINSITFTLQSASMVDIRWYRNVANNVVTEGINYKVTFTNVQLEQGTESSTYTPYQPPQYNRIWIDKPTLNKNDILTKDKLYVHSKKYLLSDIFDTVNGTSLVDYIKDNNDTWISDTIHYQETGLPFNTYVTNFSGFCDTIDVYVNNSSATNTFINISTPGDGFQVVFIDLCNPSATWAKPSDLQSFLLMNDSYLMLYYSGNAEDSFEQSNVSYIDLKPLSAGNNTLTVTNEINPTSCQYKYYADKEN